MAVETERSGIRRSEDPKIRKGESMKQSAAGTLRLIGIGFLTGCFRVIPLSIMSSLFVLSFPFSVFASKSCWDLRTWPTSTSFLPLSGGGSFGPCCSKGQKDLSSRRKIPVSCSLQHHTICQLRSLDVIVLTARPRGCNWGEGSFSHLHKKKGGIWFA